MKKQKKSKKKSTDQWIYFFSMYWLFRLIEYLMNTIHNEKSNRLNAVKLLSNLAVESK